MKFSDEDISYAEKNFGCGEKGLVWNWGSTKLKELYKSIELCGVKEVPELTNSEIAIMSMRYGVDIKKLKELINKP